MDFKNLKLVQNKNHVKDPIRYPKVITPMELQSKKDFNENLQLTGRQVYKKMLEFIK